MTSHMTRLAAAVALVVVGAGSAAAQPVVPARPQQPAFSPYLSMLGPWGPGFGYWGLTVPQQNFMQQTYQLQTQLQATQQNLTNLQNQTSLGLVNPYLPVTGRGATYGNLGHWYPSARGGGGGGMYGGAMMAPGSRMGATGGARTAGSGIPIAPARR